MGSMAAQNGSFTRSYSSRSGQIGADGWDLESRLMLSCVRVCIARKLIAMGKNGAGRLHASLSVHVLLTLSSVLSISIRWLGSAIAK